MEDIIKQMLDRLESRMTISGQQVAMEVKESLLKLHSYGVFSLLREELMGDFSTTVLGEFDLESIRRRHNETRGAILLTMALNECAAALGKPKA